MGGHGFKNVTVRVPKDSNLYAKLRAHVEKGDSWSGAALRSLRDGTADDTLAYARSQAEMVNARLREERKVATQKIEEAQKQVERLKTERDQATNLLIALFQWVANNGVPK